MTHSKLFCTCSKHVFLSQGKGGPHPNQVTNGQQRAHLNTYISPDTTWGNKAKDITPSIAWRREAWKEEALDDLPWKDERGPSSIRRTLEPFQRRRWGNFWETGWSAYGLFRAHRHHTELNWTNCNQQRCLTHCCNTQSHRFWGPFIFRAHSARKTA